MSDFTYTKLSGQDHESDPPEYPPAPVPTGKNTTYRFEPRYPVQASGDRAVATLAANRRDALIIVREAFPVLEDFPDDRITFYIQRDWQWTKLLRSSFEGLAELAPGEILVRIDDGLGDREKRLRRECAIAAAWTAGSVIFLGLSALFILKLLGKM